MARPLPFKRLDPRTPLLVRQILQLANKYSMDHFRNRIVEHIELDWPKTIYQWDLLETEIRSIRSLWTVERRNEPDQIAFIDDHLPEPASAIRLARDCDIPSILPAAFYHLSRLSPVYDDWHGLRQETQGDSRRTAKWELLATEDFICLLKGRERLSEAVCELQFAQVFDSEDHYGVDCNASERRKVIQEIRDQCQRSRDILQTARRLQEKLAYGQICGLCYSSVRQELTRFRRQLWLQLPEFFGLAEGDFVWSVICLLLTTANVSTFVVGETAQRLEKQL
jgi:hypothetical protein